MNSSSLLSAAQTQPHLAADLLGSGMSSEHQFAHPVADAAALGSTPLAVRLLGEDYVLWRDAHGTPCAARDRCPHRGTQLSLGRVLRRPDRVPVPRLAFRRRGALHADPGAAVVRAAGLARIAPAARACRRMGCSGCSSTAE